MLRLLLFLAALGLSAWGLSWLADNPAVVTLTFRGVEYNAMTAFGIAVAFALALSFGYALLRFLARTPALVVDATRARRREKGFAALSSGLIAIGAGKAREAQALAYEADRYFGDEPLTKLLRAQTAQLNGDRAGAVAAFHDMLASEDTHLLGLRGLHVEARRAGNAQAALEYAQRAYARAGAPWAAQAVLDDFASRGDWAHALTAVETDARAGLIDKPTANRWRAALKTALAEERAERDPRGALALAKEALDLAPTLVPAAVLSGRLTAAAGDLRRAARLLETAYAAAPHPDLAEAYVRLRPGDAAGDRLARARTLARIAPAEPESALALARAALEAQDIDLARATLAPLCQGSGARPTARACLLMAEIEEAAGDDGGVREWLARAARAPRDRAWIAQGVIADRWAPAGPDGALDAFAWRTPPERSGEPAIVWIPAPRRPTPPAAAPAIPAPEPTPSPSPSAVAPRPARRIAAPPAMLLANAPDDPGPQARSGTQAQGA